MRLGKFLLTATFVLITVGCSYKVTAPWDSYPGCRLYSNNLYLSESENAKNTQNCILTNRFFTERLSTVKRGEPK